MAVANLFSVHTIDSTSHVIFKEKGSKFFAFAYPVKDEIEIKKLLEALRKEYFDASHHCYAWILGPDKKRFRAFDDGEPNHSAGAPILGQIKSKDLTNILVVVVRYFGGTKLGIGGLTQAYKTAAELVLSNANTIEVELTSSFILNYSYSSSPEVMRLIKEFDAKIESQDFADEASIRINVRLRSEEIFLGKKNYSSQRESDSLMNGRFNNFKSIWQLLPIKLVPFLSSVREICCADYGHSQKF